MGGGGSRQILSLMGEEEGEGKGGGGGGGAGGRSRVFVEVIGIKRILLTLPLPRVINLKFPLQPHQKYYITQYGELGFS